VATAALIGTELRTRLEPGLVSPGRYRTTRMFPLEAFRRQQVSICSLYVTAPLISATVAHTTLTSAYSE
jgi:hypothetical protein